MKNIIEIVQGDLLASDCTHILHQANTHCTMGAGIARLIANMYPEAQDADNRTVMGDPKKLGTFSRALCHNGLTIYNVYGQHRFNKNMRQTNYEAIYKGLEAVKEDIQLIPNRTGLKLGIPYMLSSGLAGGDWKIIRVMIDSIFGDVDYKVEIYALPQFFAGVKTEPLTY